MRMRKEVGEGTYANFHPRHPRSCRLFLELEDRTLAEAAGILTTTVQALESRLYRARQQLRTRPARWLGAS